MAVELDYCEYSSDALAQAAYVTNAAEDSNTKLLCHFDGADGSQDNITPTIGGTITTVGTAQLDTAQQKFGSASFLLDGNSDYGELATSADYAFGTGAFTLECWVMFASTTGNLTLIDCDRSDNGARLDVQGTSVVAYVDGGGWVFGTIARTADTWYHVALVRSSNSLYAFVNGTQSGSTQDVTGKNVTNTYGVRIGCCRNVSDVYENYLNGWIDEVRISNVARWTANFTAPTAPYPILQSYSEATIKTQGTYSLKGVATTGALNKTLTKTGTNINLSGANTIKLDMYASRVGANIKFGIYDSGGTTSEFTPTINSANTWETKIMPIGHISSANKDAITQLIFTVANADSATTFYVDNVYGYNKSQLIMVD